MYCTDQHNPRLILLLHCACFVYLFADENTVDSETANYSRENPSTILLKERQCLPVLCKINIVKKYLGYQLKPETRFFI